MKESKESLSFEIEFFEGLVAQDGSFVDALIPLGDAYTKAGDYEKGLKVDLRLSRLRPNDPVVQYNLACSFSLLGELDLAYDALERAIILGYDDFKHMMKDADLKNIVHGKGFVPFLERVLKKVKKQLPE
jgi:tetratricopeptide (TPR) repeat protein